SNGSLATKTEKAADSKYQRIQRNRYRISICGDPDWPLCLGMEVDYMATCPFRLSPPVEAQLVTRNFFMLGNTDFTGRRHKERNAPRWIFKAHQSKKSIKPVIRDWKYRVHM